LAEQLVYLFSSDTSPQYERDILNVLAAPKGARWVFRYSRDIVAPELRAVWGSASLEDAPGLVCFSLQQREQYFDPAFIPIRRVRIKRTRVNGSQHLVAFELGDLVTLPAESPDHLDKQVRGFTNWVRGNVPDSNVPYESSLGRGASVLESGLVWDNATEMANIFERATAFLSGTDSFRATRFVRFDSIAQNGQTVWSEFGDKDKVELTAGQTYQLRLVHYQPNAIADRQAFAINVGEDLVQIIGEPRFEVASRYDEIDIILHSQSLAGIAHRNTILVIEPYAGVDGPRIELPLQIAPPTTRTVMSVLAPVGVLAAVGLPSALNASTTLKVALVIVGVLAAAILQLFGIGLPNITNPFPAAPAPSQPGRGEGEGQQAGR
jgi:hypothetical protein